MDHGECQAQKADKRSDLVIMIFGATECHGNTEFTQNLSVNPSIIGRKMWLECVVRVTVRWHYLTDTARNVVFVIARGRASTWNANGMFVYNNNDSIMHIYFRQISP